MRKRQISTQIPRDVLTLVEELARVELRPRSHMINVLLDEALKARAEHGAPAPFAGERVKRVRKRVPVPLFFEVEPKLVAAADAYDQSLDALMAILVEEAVVARAVKAVSSKSSRKTA